MKEDIFGACRVFCFFFDLKIHYVFLELNLWFNITNIIPHSRHESSLEQKRCSVDFAAQ